jgi:hypothetical protein
MRRTIRAAIILGSLSAAAASANADMIVTFSYFGRGGPSNGGLISTGTGSFTFADDLTVVTLSDLTSFDFTLDENTPNSTVFGLTDLTSFATSVGTGPSLLILALETTSVQGSNDQTWPRELSVSSLGPDGATTYFEILGVSIFLTSGSVTVNSVVNRTAPEPSSLALAVLGTGLVAAGSWRGIRLRKPRRNPRAGRSSTSPTDPPHPRRPQAPKRRAIKSRPAHDDPHRVLLLHTLRCP